MADQLNIHRDFKKIRGIELSFNPWLLTAMNGAMHLMASRKWSKFKNIAKQHKIIGPDGYRISAWIIKPESLKAPYPVLLYFHGGAFIMKHAPQHIENAVLYAREAECCVIFVDYRLAPKHPFPAGFNDCYAALTWAHQNAEKLGVDTQHVAVGGDSAGAALAAAAAQKAVHEDGVKLCGQLLLYPVTDSNCESKSSAAYANVPPFKNFSRAKMWRAYLGRELAAGAPKYASPLHGNLSELSPAYIETGEYDPLNDEGREYAKALTAHGVDVELNETEGTIHGFDLLVPDAAPSRAAMARRVQFLFKIFHM